MKRTVTLLALLAALCCLLTVSAAAADAPTSGTCGENLTWTLDGEGTLRIAGEGAMEDYGWPGGLPWRDSQSEIKAVVIESGVTTIGSHAFDTCRNLTSVTFNGSSQLTTIGKDAFYQCRSLTGITLPESVTSIGASAFYQCSSLTEITLPESVTAIGNSAFRFCESLTSITIPKSVTSIGADAFSNCNSLTDVSITNMDAWCRIDFGNSNANPMYCAQNIRLNGSKIASVTVPEGATELKYTFYGFKDLIRVTLPKSLTGIGEGTFDNCTSLTNLTIPDGVTAIGDSACSRCTSLTSVTIPEGVTAIGDGAFDNCSSLVSINIPEGVTEIGSDAFRSCIRLSSVYISDLDAWYSINFGYRFANPLYYAKNLYLNGQLVESLEIPESASVIPTGLFRSAKCLKRVAIPRSLAGVAANAFEKCTNITEVFYEGSESEWAALPISAGNDPLKNAQVYFNSTLDDYYCRITVAVSDGGRVTVDHTAARVGETVTVTAAPYQGYELTAVCVDGVEIEGNTFAVTGNHTVSAVFTRVPVVGGTEDFRLEGISVRTAAGEELQELPQGSLLVTVAVKHLNETGSGTILLAQYDSQGRYRGLMWLTLDEMPQGMTLRVTLPVDNSSGEIANLKVFVVEDLTSPLPVGTPVSFGQV